MKFTFLKRMMILVVGLAFLGMNGVISAIYVIANKSDRRITLSYGGQAGATVSEISIPPRGIRTMAGYPPGQITITYNKKGSWQAEGRTERIVSEMPIPPRPGIIPLLRIDNVSRTGYNPAVRWDWLHRYQTPGAIAVGAK